MGQVINVAEAAHTAGFFFPNGPESFEEFPTQFEEVTFDNLLLWNDEKRQQKFSRRVLYLSGTWKLWGPQMVAIFNDDTLRVLAQFIDEGEITNPHWYLGPLQLTLKHRTEGSAHSPTTD